MAGLPVAREAYKMDFDGIKNQFRLPNVKA